MKKLVHLALTLFCLYYTTAFCQKATIAEVKEIKSAISFENNLSWKKILEKAKKEGKYIFLDCFTTWCSPCKRLEKEVYIIDSVGTFFNDHFICVKMQMDKKKIDSESVKARYNDAVSIEKTYEIDSYPTLIFFNPQGEIVNKEVGYFEPGRLLSIARVALQPGRIYSDPVSELKKSIKMYQKKQATPNDLKQLIDKAIYFGKNNIADSLSKMYMTLLRKQPLSDLYKKDILLSIGNTELEVNDPLLALFYPDTHKADAIVEDDFSRFVIDRYIKTVYFDKPKFFEKEISAYQWDSLEHIITDKFSKDFALRAIKAAQTEWYMHNMEKMLFPEFMLFMVENYGKKSVLTYDYFIGGKSRFEDSKKTSSLIINAICFDFIFKLPENKHLIDRGINVMKQIVQDGEQDSTAWWNSLTFDTYANLLYKNGRIKEAIEYEQRALNLLKAEPQSPKDMITSYEEVLKRMRSGIPTWPI